MRKYSDEILAGAFTKIAAEQDRINSLRTNTRTVAIILVGTILGYSVKLEDVKNIWFFAIAAILVVAAQGWQDYILHKYRHGWHGVDKRTRQYMWGELAEDQFKLLEYKSEDETNAEFFSRTSGWIYIILLAGSVGLLMLKLLA